VPPTPSAEESSSAAGLGASPSAPHSEAIGELRDETWRAKNRPDNLFGSSVVEEGMRCFVLMLHESEGSAPTRKRSRKTAEASESGAAAAGVVDPAEGAAAGAAEAAEVAEVAEQAGAAEPAGAKKTKTAGGETPSEAVRPKRFAAMALRVTPSGVPGEAAAESGDLLAAAEAAPAAASAPAAAAAPRPPTRSLQIGLREVTINNALMQIVREIVMNCTDRPDVRCISVSICPEDGCITVRNDGDGIPIGKNLITISDDSRRASLQDLWSPTLLLARWGCSTNYDDSQVRFTAGKNGLGAKAVLAWCARVEVRAVDAVRKRSFLQTWQDGMRVETPAVVKENVTRKGFTEFKMWPDYDKLVKLPLPLTPDQVGALRWCVWECSTVLPPKKGYRVTIDGVALPDHTPEGMMRAILNLCIATTQRLGGVGGTAPGASASTLAALRATTAPLGLVRGGKGEGEGAAADDTASVASGSVSGSAGASSSSPSVPILRAHVSWAPHEETLTGLAFPTHGLAPHLASLLPAIGFVNGVRCPKGTHRQRWESALTTDLNKKLGAKINLTRGTLLNNMVIAACAKINQPRFGSQTKEELVTRLPPAATLAGAVPVAPLARAGFFTFLKSQHAAQSEAVAVRTLASTLLSTPGSASASVTSRRRYDVDDVEHYEGAEMAGRERCFLFLTEGLSAQNCARNVIARLPPHLKRVCGSFALRGKLINAMSNATTKVLANKEVQGLLRICNLNPSVTYASPAERATLRYAKLVLWTDADTDGGHIAWLVFLLIYKFWPALATTGYVERFVTPLLKVLDPKHPMQFYSEAARDRWLEQAAVKAGLMGEAGEGAAAGEAAEPAGEAGGFAAKTEADAAEADTPAPGSSTALDFDALATPDMRRRAMDAAVSAKGVRVKYFKGLGRLMAEDEKDLAARFDDLRIRLEIAAGEEQVIEALGADDAEARREIQLRRAIRALPYDDVERVTISEFIDGELLPYMRDANLRQVPGIDGLVEVSRMILAYFYVLPSAAAPGAEHVVARLAAAIAAKMDYHHGETSMAGAIATMAQDFAGKNNLNLLQPRGQFGERSEPTPGQPRYTNTALQPYAKAILPAADYEALPMPRHGEVPTVMPGVLPLLLVNGATGIGYGHSTEIPPHDPREIARLCASWIEAHETTTHIDALRLDDPASADAPMDSGFRAACESVLPWVRGLERQPERAPDGGIESRGRARIAADLRSLEVTELPAGVWTKNARASLAKIPWLASVYMHPRITTVMITAEIPDTTKVPDDVRAEVQAGVLDGPCLLRALKLVRRISYANMKAYDRTGALRSFASVAEILHDFALLRIWVYARRRVLELRGMEREERLLRGKVGFMELQLSGKMDLRTFPTRADAYQALRTDHLEQVPLVDGKHNYLDGISIWNLTRTEVQRLRDKHEEVEQQRIRLEKATPFDLWREDLELARETLSLQWRSEAPQEEDAAASRPPVADAKAVTRKRSRAK